MKRSAVLLLSLALVLMFSFAAYGASATVTISGEIEFDAYLRQKWDSAKEEHGELQFYAQARRYATLGLSTGNIDKGNLRLVLDFGSNKTGDDGSSKYFDWSTEDVYHPGETDVQFRLTSARLEARGALWKGGSNAIVILGRHPGTTYSPWVAHHNRVRQNNRSTSYPGGQHRNAFLNSVEVRDLKVGPFTVKAIHGYSSHIIDGSDKLGDDQATWINATGDLGGVTTSFTAVNRLMIGYMPADDRKHVWDYAVELSAKPMDGLELSGAVAVDGQGQGFPDPEEETPTTSEVEPKMAFEVAAKLTTIPNVTLNGAVFRAEDGFAPPYAQWNRDWRDWEDKRKGNYEVFKYNRQGFRIGAETEIQGLKLNGGFLNMTDSGTSGTDYSEQTVTAGVSTKIENFDVGADVTLTKVTDLEKNVSDKSLTKTVITVGTNVANISLKYTGTIETDEDTKHELVAETTRNLFFADNVKFNGTVILQGDDVDYGIDATWKAPNDLQFTIGYANYNKSGDNFVHKKDPDGFYIRTYTKIKF